MSEIATTKKQRELMAHAINLEERIKNKSRRRNRRGDDEFRNYYCASVGSPDDDVIGRLVYLGLMIRGPLINGGREFYAYVTEAGINELTA